MKGPCCQWAMGSGRVALAVGVVAFAGPERLSRHHRLSPFTLGVDAPKGRAYRRLGVQGGAEGGGQGMRRRWQRPGAGGRQEGRRRIMAAGPGSLGLGTGCDVGWGN